MRNKKNLWMRIVRVCCMCVMLLLVITSCASKDAEPDKTEQSAQEEQEEEQEVLETLPTDLEALSFIDFGITNGVYEQGTYKGEYGGSDINGTLISAKLTFTPKGDTHILIGGKEAWGGFGLSVIQMEDTEEWVLRIYDTNGDKKGWKFDPIFLHSDVAGVPLIGKEVDVKISIQYVDQDGDGVENDVKLGMWFNDRLYDNEYIYLKNYTNLGYCMGTWMTIVVREDATLVIN